MALLKSAGLPWELGYAPSPQEVERLATSMARCLIEACGGAALSDFTRLMLRLPPLPRAEPPACVTVSGGVAEYLGADEPGRFGDLGYPLADAVRNTLSAFAPWRVAEYGLRATVIGASQFSVQLSGNTIFVDPPEALPLANIPVIRPVIDYATLNTAEAIGAAMAQLGLDDSAAPVAVAYEFEGDATHTRLAAFCAGIAEALAGRVLVLVGEGDFGGLIGAELRRAGWVGGIVSIDGIKLRELDYIDIGEMLQVSGGVPVVVKSLVFGTM
jgi:ethanolamine utilization protein EutA